MKTLLPIVTKLLILASCFVFSIDAFSSQDHEIFRLHDEIRKSEGIGATFYDLLGISQSASQAEISKAYRVRSRLLHPDKIKQSVRNSRSSGSAQERLRDGRRADSPAREDVSSREMEKALRSPNQQYARLGLVTEILKGPGRERYDFFLTNGFPVWRGTGYYYDRFRPGLVSVLFGLFVFGGGLVHYVALYLGWKRQKRFMQRYIENARKSAWGSRHTLDGIPGLEGSNDPIDSTSDAAPVAINRRQKRLQEKEEKRLKRSGGGSTDSGNTRKVSKAESIVQSGEVKKRRVQAENGKTLLVDSNGCVYLEETIEGNEPLEYLLDVDEIQKPSIKDTIIYRVPQWIIHQVGIRPKRT